MRCRGRCGLALALAHAVALAPAPPVALGGGGRWRWRGVPRIFRGLRGNLDKLTKGMFCPICHNLLFVKMSEQGALVASCNYCLSKQELTSTGGGAVVVSDTPYKSDAAKYSHLMNPLLHEDATLPRVSDVPCPGPACTRPPDAPHGALFVKFDADNLRFLYSCTFCKHFWVPGSEIK